MQFAIIADMNKEHRSSRGWSIVPAVNELKLGFQRCTGMVPEVFGSTQIAEAQKKYPYLISVGNNPLSAKYVNVNADADAFTRTIAAIASGILK